MSDELYSIKKSTLEGIADAVRTKDGSTSAIPVPELKQAILNITTTPVVETVDMMLLANNWQGASAPYIYNMGLDANYDCEISLNGSASTSLVNSILPCLIYGNFEDNNLRAFGTKPDVDIPIILKKWKHDGSEPTPGPEPGPEPSPLVPQTGTWQYKTTPSTGFIIIGKDDDTQDQAMYVRLVNGYGFPVTINTMIESQYDLSSHKLKSDADTDVSMYPEGSISRFPDGCNVHELNVAVIENNLGEVAQHGGSNKSIWNSDDPAWEESKIDTMYATYTEGGGTRTRDDFWTEFKRLNASSDRAQGATYITDSRRALEEDLGHSILTLGSWGSSGDVKVDDIVVCQRSFVGSGSYMIAREYNYWGDGPVTSYNSYRERSPWSITRASDGLNPDKITNYCELAYQDQSCIEVFGHLLFSGYGSADEWSNLTTTLGIIKSFSDAGKIKVVTRYQYSQLGEFVDNPIASISVKCNNAIRAVGDTLTPDDFICTANLQNGETISCESDKILNIGTTSLTEAGTVPINLRYRGYSASTSVLVLDKLPESFIYENYSEASDTELLNSVMFVSLAPPTEIGKTYHIDFDMNINVDSVKYAKHLFVVTAKWSSNTSDTYQLELGNNTIHVSMDVECTSSYAWNKLFSSSQTNIHIASWSISNLYMWEVG